MDVGGDHANLGSEDGVRRWESSFVEHRLSTLLRHQTAADCEGLHAVMSSRAMTRDRTFLAETASRASDLPRRQVAEVFDGAAERSILYREQAPIQVARQFYQLAPPSRPAAPPARR
jgi:hypothetical protein